MQRAVKKNRLMNEEALIDEFDSLDKGTALSYLKQPTVSVASCSQSIYPSLENVNAMHESTNLAQVEGEMTAVKKSEHLVQGIYPSLTNVNVPHESEEDEMVKMTAVEKSEHLAKTRKCL